MEAELVTREGLDFRSIPAGGVHGVGPVRMARNTFRLLQGGWFALRLLREDRPQVMFTTGGYLSVPTALAARLRGVPVALYLPDVEPGLSVKFVASFAQAIGVTVEDSRAFVPERKVTVTGYPLGGRVTRWERDTGRQSLGLAGDEPVLLVFGGSRGARSINRAVIANLEALLTLAQIVHVTGHLDWEEVTEARGKLRPEQQKRYHAYVYLHDEMGAALAVADLAVSRAGASILGEFPYFGLPAVLVPYPYAWRYQKVNAAWLADRGASTVVEDAMLREQLVPTVAALLDDESRLVAMRQSARSLARPNAAGKLAEMILSLGEGA